MKLVTYRKYITREAITGGWIGFFLSALDLAINNSFPIAKLLMGFTLGALIVLANQFIFRNLERRMNNIILFIIKLLLLNILVFFVLMFFVWLLFMIGLLQGEIDSLYDFYKGWLWVDAQIVSFQITFLMLFYYEVRKLIGPGTLENYIIGKYKIPRKEERIFMFIDMKSSTTYAEKLGTEKYYDLLNYTFHMMSVPILQYKAEIYKYIGDEIIFTWKRKAGLQKNNCVNIFFGIKESLKAKKDYFMENFGVMPEFKAGIHIGNSIVAELGELKKEIGFSGDVLNTASRIQGMCNDLDSELLVSEAIYDALQNKEKYKPRKIENVELRGKKERMDLYDMKIRGSD